MFTMKNTLKLYVLSLPLFSLSLFAGVPAGNMMYSISGAESIPTLGSTMLIVLSVLLLVVAFRISKEKNGNKLFSSLVAVIALALGGGGVKLVSDAEALMGISLPLPLNSGPTSGQVELSAGYNIFQNGHPTVLTIDSVNVTATAFACDDPFSTAGSRPLAAMPPPIQVCADGVQLQSQAECHLFCFSTLEVSDLRLKKEIKFLAKLEKDIDVYSFKYLPEFSSSEETHVGVMAQDLLKSDRYKNSVKTMTNNYYAVDYQSLGLKMITLKEWNESPENIKAD